MERDYTALVPMTTLCKLAPIVKGVLVFVFAVALGAFTANQLRLLYLSRTPPVVFHAMVIDPDVLVLGNPLHVIAKLDRIRVCWSERRIWVADVATNTNRWEAHFGNGSTNLGYTEIANDYHIPLLNPDGTTVLVPGEEYVFRMIGHYRCGSGDEHTIKGPEARFTVR